MLSPILIYISGTSVKTESVETDGCCFSAWRDKSCLLPEHGSAQVVLFNHIVFFPLLRGAIALQIRERVKLIVLL